MASGDFQSVVSADGPGAAVAEESEVVVLVDGDKSRELSIFPLLLGVLVLILDIYLLVRLSAYFFTKNLQAAISLAFILVSIIICVFLIVYAFGHSRLTSTDGHRRASSAFTTAIVLPLVLGAVAVAMAIGGMEFNRAASERQTSKSCVEYIEMAQNIAKDNPRFRMPAGDRDELRCGINAAIGR